MNAPEPCRFWLQGTCSFGDRCRKSHTSTARTISLPAAVGPQRVREACRFFAIGICKNGNLCPFSHSILEHTSMSTSNLHLCSRILILSVAKPNPIVCKYFRLGHCSSVTCPFEHVSDQTPSSWRSKLSAPTKVSTKFIF